MKKNIQQSHVNGHFGQITLNVMDDGIVLVQERANGAVGAIALNPEDCEKLAKALFAKKRDAFPDAPTNNPGPAVSSQQPASFPLPQPPVPPSYMEQQKAMHRQAYGKWTDEEERQLATEFMIGKTVPEMMDIHGRNEGAIYSRLKKLGLT